MKKPITLKKILLIVLTTLILLVGLFITRGWWQPGILIVRRFILLFIFLVIAIVFLVFLWKRTANIWQKIALVMVGLVFGTLGYLLGPGVYEYISLYNHYSKINKIELDRLPITAHERIHPYNSIKVHARQAFQDTETATDFRFVKVGKDYYFTAAVGPDRKYLFQRWSKGMSKVLATPGTKNFIDFSQRNQHEVKFYTGDFLPGWKNIKRNVRSRFNFGKFFSYEPGETRLLKNDEGEWVQVVGLIKYKGVVFPRPVFGGVIVIPQNNNSIVSKLRRGFLGFGKYISPDEMQNYDYLKGQNVMPVRVVRFIANSFRFQEGFLAPMPGYHEGDIRIPDMPEDINPQPFIAYFNMDYKNPNHTGLLNFFALEPYSSRRDRANDEAAQGLNTTIYIPGTTDEAIYYYDHAKRKEGLSGPSATAGYVMGTRKEVDWSRSAVQENRPFIKDICGTNKTQLFWFTTTVTSSDTSKSRLTAEGIPDIAILDPHYNHVVWLDPNPDRDRDSVWKAEIISEFKSCD